MKRGIQAYRVLTGSQYDPGDDTFVATVYHMTFYAKDKDVLAYLMIVAQCPNGRIHPADQVYSNEAFSGPQPTFSAN